MTKQLPAPRIIDPTSVTSFRWGVIGAGGIARTFVDGVQRFTAQKVVAVASRTPGKAEDFARDLGLEAHDNYEDLLAREDIDIIYIATLPSQHRDHALMAIAAGKHVLVEKPVALVPDEAREIFAVAKAKGVMAMEAMWTRYLPQYDILHQLLENGELGRVDMLNVSMCQSNLGVARLWNKNEGDPLFDMGIYPVSLAQTLFGHPVRITAQAVLDANGIDQEVSAQLHYADGARAYILVSGRAGINSIAQIAGEDARLDMGPEFFCPSRVEIGPNEVYGQTTVWTHSDGPVGHQGLCYQATAMASYLDRGLLESPLESHEDSVANLEVCAEIIRLVGASIY
ncbi:MAG: Gfo/Idh/MocA family protein [Micrococcales bacterium]